MAAPDSVVKIDDMWIGAIAEALAENSSVQSLWLQDNQITDKGAQKLVDGIKVCCQTQSQDLNGNRVRDALNSWHQSTRDIIYSV